MAYAIYTPTAPFNMPQKQNVVLVEMKKDAYKTKTISDGNRNYIYGMLLFGIICVAFISYLLLHSIMPTEAAVVLSCIAALLLCLGLNALLRQ